MENPSSREAFSNAQSPAKAARDTNSPQPSVLERMTDTADETGTRAIESIRHAAHSVQVGLSRGQRQIRTRVDGLGEALARQPAWLFGGSFVLGLMLGRFAKSSAPVVGRAQAARLRANSRANASASGLRFSPYPIRAAR